MRRLCLAGLVLALLVGGCGTPAAESRPRLQPTAVGPTSEPARPLQRVAIGTSGPSLSWLPAQLAWTVGYFREEGLDVEFVQVGGTSMVPALLSGELTLTTIISPVGANAGQGGDGRIVQMHVLRVQHVLSVRPEITAIEQLAGKRIAVQNLGTLTAHEARKVVEHFALADVAVIAVGGDLERIAAMETGAADANVSNIPGNLVAERRGFPTLLRISTILDIPTGGYGTSLTHLREQPDVVARLLRATARALPSMTRQRELVTSTIEAFMDLPPEDAARAYEMVADTYSPNGVPTEAQMATYLDLLRATAGLPAEATAAQVADFTIARRVAQELGLPSQ
jgi:ABC-type nitrate/sulfonate/bicarbonate transport system substrate-binding protein